MKNQSNKTGNKFIKDIQSQKRLGDIDYNFFTILILIYLYLYFQDPN